MKTTSGLRRFYREMAKVLQKQLHGYKLLYGKTPPCADNCKGHRCCFQQIQATPLEALNIVEYVKKSVKDERVFDALEAWLEEYSSWPLEVQSHESKHFFKGLACPFYIDKRCAIYPARPTVCRTYFSLEEDEGPCNGTHAGDVTLLDNTKYIKSVGKGSDYYVMPLMVIAVLWRDRPEKRDLVEKADGLVLEVRQAWQERIVERERKKAVGGE